MKVISHSLIILLLFISSKSTAVEITPLFGYRGGGEVVDLQSEQKHNIVSSNIYGLILGKPYEYGKTLEVYYSHQSSDIKSINVASTPFTASFGATIPLTIDYLHFGGTAPISDEGDFKTFVSGGLGFTYLSPNFTGLDSELRASFSIGVGLKWPITEHTALRLETRGLATLFNNNSSIFCSGGCTLSVNGNFFLQGELFAGLAVEF